MYQFPHWHSSNSRLDDICIYILYLTPTLLIEFDEGHWCLAKSIQWIVTGIGEHARVYTEKYLFQTYFNNKFSCIMNKVALILQTTFSIAFPWRTLCILIQISLKFVPEGSVNNTSALVHMMMYSNVNILHITGLLWGESTSDRWIPLTKASDRDVWFFLWSAPEQTVEQTIKSSLIWDDIAFIMASL